MGWTDGIERQYQQAKARVDTCLRCGQCESKCPYRLPIRELLPTRLASLTKRHETVSTHVS